MQTAMPLINLRALLLALAVTLFVPNAHALSVGEMSVDSNLGEPLALSILMSAKRQNELDSLKVRLAPRAVFEQIGVPYPFAADDIQFTIDDENGNLTLRVYTSNALDTPYLHLLIQLSWSGGSMLREYVALIDPADYGSEVESIALSEVIIEGIDNQVTQSGNWVTVVSGDTVSSIAKRYRPSDVSMHQAWIALFNLNRGAFPSNNINLLEKGVRLKIPSREQMLALSPQRAISKVQSLSPATKTVKKQASQPTSTAEQATSIQPAQQDVLTIGTRDSQAASTTNGLNSAAAEEWLEGKFGEVTSIKTSMSKFSEELVAIQGENKVVANRLLQVEAQLSKISQLLELQSQTLATLNYQARLQAQAMQEATVRSTPLKESQQFEVQQPKDLAAQSQEQTQQAQQDNVIATANQSLNSALNSINGSTHDDSGVREKGAATDLSSNSVESQALQLDSGVTTSATDESSITESQRKQRIAKLEAALQANTSEAQKKQNLEVESGQTNQESFLNSNDWTESVVSVKDKIVEFFKDGTEKLTEDSLESSLVAILSKWSLYILIGLLALIGLGRFMRRRGNDVDEGNGSEIDSEIDDPTAGELNGQDSSIFTLGEESMIQSYDSPSEPMASGDSSLFAVDDQDSMIDNMDSEMLSQQSTIGQVMGADPLAEAEVYLAYDKKEQAIKVLKEAYVDNPKDQDIAIKLLGLYQESDDLKAFSRVLETVYANKDESVDDDRWLKIKTMGKAYAPTHPLFLDNDFDNPMPVLRNEIEDDNLEERFDTAVVTSADKLDKNTEESVDAAQLKLSDEDEPENVDSFTLDMESGDIGDAVKEINQHDPDTSLALARAYAELGEIHIAKDFISDVISSGSDELKAKAKKLLKSIKS